MDQRDDMPLKREGEAFMLMTILWRQIPEFVQIVCGLYLAGVGIKCVLVAICDVSLTYDLSVFSVHGLSFGGFLQSSVFAPGVHLVVHVI